jgi:Ni,Fe-hydrogenase I cytochrome b subunit
MTLRDFLSPNPRLTRQEYELARTMGRQRYAVRGGLRMARWLLTLSIVILVGRGYLAGDWTRMLNVRVALEVLLLMIVCSAFVAYTTYALIWKALHHMFGPRPDA